MPTFHLHITGRVQGVGFRPFVYNLAHSNKINGWVNNTLDGVHIKFNSKDIEKASRFTQQILTSAPKQAKIEGHHLTPLESNEKFNSFYIKTSEDNSEMQLSVTPDFSICESCKAELRDQNNRRYNYPFITCTNCGPRLSIITGFPYDREKTTMQSFPMCDKCQNEYENPTDRRFYSQTNSCCDCPIKLTLYDSNATPINNDQNAILDRVASIIENGGIIAIKGIGGYLLIADASNEETIGLLRQRKHRPNKPFAVMYPNLVKAKKDLHIHQEAESLLCSPESPILLLRYKQSILENLTPEAIAPGLDRLGVMLPYTGLFVLLFERIKNPMIATSANITDEPIIYSDNEALRKLGGIADYILVNDREISFPQDDSVLVLDQLNSPIILRRSRGLAPSLDGVKISNVQDSTLAIGADLKSSFSIYLNDRIYTSQYLGNQSDFETGKRFESVLNRFLQTLGCTPQKILLDLHPGYHSTHLGQIMAEQWSIPLDYIQHHEAHFGAILAEHQLLNDSSPVLGVVWDGTGYSEDGNIWGGEFFMYEDEMIKHIDQFSYYDQILGDKMSKEPRISALALSKNIPVALSNLESNFNAQEWNIYTKLLEKDSELKTSSVGRIFDAVASILNICQLNSYEGEAASYLEVHARKYIEKFGTPSNYYSFFGQDTGLNTEILILQIWEDKLHGLDIGLIAAKFHLSLCKAVEHIAEKKSIHQIAFSGGVFQNALLVSLLKEILSVRFKLYFHSALSPNDECISIGQLAIQSLNNRLRNKLKKEFREIRN